MVNEVSDTKQESIVVEARRWFDYAAKLWNGGSTDAVMVSRTVTALVVAMGRVVMALEEIEGKS